jgi:hypothetical protein
MAWATPSSFGKLTPITRFTTSGDDTWSTGARELVVWKDLGLDSETRLAGPDNLNYRLARRRRAVRQAVERGKRLFVLDRLRAGVPPVRRCWDNFPGRWFADQWTFGGGNLGCGSICVFLSNLDDANWSCRIGYRGGHDWGDGKKY